MAICRMKAKLAKTVEYHPLDEEGRERLFSEKREEVMAKRAREDRSDIAHKQMKSSILIVDRRIV